VAEGIGQVFVAMADPYEMVGGQGIQQLRAAGITVQLGLLELEARQLNAAYIKRIEYRLPWVIAKWAMTLDGRIASRTGHSQWISGSASRQWVHELRGRVDVIMVGSGTALADDPMLNSRLPEGQPSRRTALRVVIDSQLQLPLESRLAQSAGQLPTLLWAGPEADPAKAEALREIGCTVQVSESSQPNDRLKELLGYLVSKYQATNLLVEGGSRLLGSLFEIRQIDQCEVFIAPKLVGGHAYAPLACWGCDQVGDGPVLECIVQSKRGEDWHVSSRLNWQRGKA
jgi:diaminohydroxyphosphoribosylaminopyrimidine deaminase/5-amino-6-(5-phosphoribosylamino)uracil reductase